MSTYGEEFAASNKLSVLQADALEGLRDGGVRYIPARTLNSLRRRELVEYKDGRYVITGHGLNVLMANS